MKMCLKCFCLWPKDAVYCGRCRRPLGVKRCPKGHANSLSTPGLTCTTCNEGPLVPGVAVLPLGGVVSLFALALFVLCFRWAWHHPATILCTACRAALWILSLLFGVAPRSITRTLSQAVAWYLTLWVLSYGLPGALGKSVRQTLRMLPRLLWRGLRSGVKTLLPLVMVSGGAVRSKIGVARTKDVDAK